MTRQSAKAVLEDINEGEYDTVLDQIALAVSQRRRRTRLMNRPEPPIVGDFAQAVRNHPGLNAQELSVLMGISVSRVYQVSYMADKHIRPVDPEERPRRFWPKDS